jgi:hypothetical protein
MAGTCPGGYDHHRLGSIPFQERKEIRKEWFLQV